MKNHRLLTTALLFVAAFLLCGIVRVTNTNPSVLNGFTFQVCGAMLLVWAMSVRTRVTDRRLRRIELRETRDRLTIVFSGNGEPPKGPVRETGSLRILRTITEQAGGTMRVSTEPCFTVTLHLNKEKPYAV